MRWCLSISFSAFPDSNVHTLQLLGSAWRNIYNIIHRKVAKAEKYNIEHVYNPCKLLQQQRYIHVHVLEISCPLVGEKFWGINHRTCLSWLTDDNDDDDDDDDDDDSDDDSDSDGDDDGDGDGDSDDDSDDDDDDVCFLIQRRW